MATENATYETRLHDVSLFIRKVTIIPSIKVVHEKALYIGLAKYATCHVEMKIYTNALGGATWSQENAFLEKLPCRITFGFIKTTAVNGAYQQNPFNFQHFSLNYATLVVNSRQQPAKAFTPVFEGNDVDYVREYLQMYSGVGKSCQDEDVSISDADFPRGNTIFVFNLTPDLSDDLYFDLVQHGNIRMEA